MGEEAEVSQAVEQLSPCEDAVLLAALKQVLEDRPSVVQELADWAVPDRAYASARLLLENRLQGTIKSFNDTSGYGFINCPDVKEAFGHDVFLHFSQLNGFGKGQEVSFAILVNGERKPQAFDVGPVANGKGGKQGAGAAAPSAAGGKGAAGGAGYGKAAWGADSWGKGYDEWSASAAWGKGGKDAWAAGGGKDPWAAKGGKDPWAAGGGKGGKDHWAAGGGKDAWGASKGAGKGEKGKFGAHSGKAAGPPPESSQEMPGVTDRRFEGTIKSFNDNKGFGFIHCDEIMETFSGDAFLHHRQYEGFQVGQAVIFAVFLNKEGKPQAKDLESADGQPPAKKAKGGWM